MEKIKDVIALITTASVVAGLVIIGYYDVVIRTSLLIGFGLFAISWALLRLEI